MKLKPNALAVYFLGLAVIFIAGVLYPDEGVQRGIVLFWLGFLILGFVVVWNASIGYVSLEEQQRREIESKAEADCEEKLRELGLESASASYVATGRDRENGRPITVVHQIWLDRPAGHLTEVVTRRKWLYELRPHPEGIAEWGWVPEIESETKDREDVSEPINIISRSIDAKDIISVDVEPQTVTVIKGTTSGNSGNAALGFLLLGVPGAIIGGAGGTSSASTVHERVTGVAVRVTVDDMDRPLIGLGFADLVAANDWVAKLKVLMHRAAKRDAGETGV